MIRLVKKYQRELSEFCRLNGLDFEKTIKSRGCWDSSTAYLIHLDDTEKTDGLLNDIPSPIVLVIKENNGNPEFEKTEHTYTYLGF